MVEFVRDHGYLRKEVGHVSLPDKMIIGIALCIIRNSVEIRVEILLRILPRRVKERRWLLDRTIIGV